MNKYNFTAGTVRYCVDTQKPLRIAWHKMPLKLFVAQYTALLNLAAYGGQTPLIKDAFHPANYTVDCSLSGVQENWRVRT